MSIFKGAAVAIITPMTETQEVNYEKLGELIEEQIAGGTDAIVICGTTGEASTLSHEEHLDAIKYTVEKVNLFNNVENIVAVKEASGNISQVAKIMQLTDGKIDLYSGNDDQVVPILSLGGSGVISVLSNVAPRETHDMVQKFLDGDVAGSREIQLRALPLIDALFCEVNPIPVKAALNLMGKEVGPLRLPLTEMEPQNQERLAKAMKDFGIKLA